MPRKIESKRQSLRNGNVPGAFVLKIYWQFILFLAKAIFLLYNEKQCHDWLTPGIYGRTHKTGFKK